MWLYNVIDIPLGCHVVSWINTMGDHVLWAMAPHTITPAVVSGVSLQSKDRIEAFSPAFLHANTIASIAEIETGFAAKDDMVPFRFSPVSSCVAPLQTEASLDGR
ncbi:hypothetical protein TNCV_3503551 [Trichonephila clavipes]|uniref:Uncharacterized protein n=1 Tax=Trichonephila clavipes TaxID=2585209 RepID=A0A8X6RWM3_TRICX|nr:hypothetical protein TNCV_3503551 [Trichonephila clavipes]